MLNWKGTLVLVPGSGSLNKLGVKTELESKVNGFFLSWMSLRLKVKADHNEYFLYSWGHSLRHSSYYGGPQLSRQKQKPHGKTENLTAKAKTSRQNQNTPRQNQKPHGKTKDLTAKPNTSQQKPNTSQQKQIPMANLKLFCYFVLAMRFLVLPWQLWATISATHQSKNKQEVFEDNKICSVGSKTAAHWKLALVVSLLWKINLSQKGIFLSLTDKWNRG